MKRIRRMTAALLSVLAVFLLLPLQALAAGSIDLNQDVSLTISYQDGNTPLVGAEFDIFLVATVDEYGELTTATDFAQFHVNIRGKDDEVLVLYNLQTFIADTNLIYISRPSTLS